jgi:hypothetical protein
MKMDYSVNYYISKLGWPIIPIWPHNHSGVSIRHKENCKRPGKTPMLKKWQIGKIPSQENVNAWYDNNPEINVGLVLGSPSGIVAIDVDGETGNEFLNELSKGDLPPTTYLTVLNSWRRYEVSI